MGWAWKVFLILNGFSLLNVPAARSPGYWNVPNTNSIHFPPPVGLHDSSSVIASASTTQPGSPAASDGGQEKKDGVKGRKDRRKQQGERLVYTRESLQHLFTLSLCKAAARLNMSARSLASVCRKLGIKKWPYKPPHYR